MLNGKIDIINSSIFNVASFNARHIKKFAEFCHYTYSTYIAAVAN